MSATKQFDELTLKQETGYEPGDIALGNIINRINSCPEHNLEIQFRPDSIFVISSELGMGEKTGYTAELVSMFSALLAKFNDFTRNCYSVAKHLLAMGCDVTLSIYGCDEAEIGYKGHDIAIKMVNVKTPSGDTRECYMAVDFTTSSNVHSSLKYLVIIAGSLEEVLNISKHVYVAQHAKIL